MLTRQHENQRIFLKEKRIFEPDSFLFQAVLVNWLKVRTQMLGRGPFVRTFSQKTMGRRFGHDFHSLAHHRRIGYFSREKVQYRFSFAVKHSPLRERYELHRFSFVRTLSVISDDWVKFVRTFSAITRFVGTYVKVLRTRFVHWTTPLTSW